MLLLICTVLPRRRVCANKQNGDRSGEKPKNAKKKKIKQNDGTAVPQTQMREIGV